jgi:hypothetical protein
MGLSRRAAITGLGASGGCALVRPRGASGLSVDADFPGGNVIVDRIAGDDVYVRQDLRDTQGDWFWWYFRVRGGAGRRLRVFFTRGNPIGVRGPAVSVDGGRRWSWLGPRQVAADAPSFEYVIPPGAEEVRFSVAVPYVEEDLRRFLDRHRGDPSLRRDILCTSRKGRKVESLRIGASDGTAEHRIILTARHHACECMASWALEGLMEEALSSSPEGQWLRTHAALWIVPFVDKDGVEEGDQGKHRRPHDHDRDYTGTSLYPEIRAIRGQVPSWSQGRLRLAMDLHCPGLRGNAHEAIQFIGTENQENWRRVQRFAALLEGGQRGPLVYRSQDDVPWGASWNTAATFKDGKPFHAWMSELPGVTAIAVELPYANARGATVTAESARLFGRDLARTIFLALRA